MRLVRFFGCAARAKPAQSHQALNLVISENAGTGERLDLLCGHFAIAPHDRLLRNYLPPRLVVHAGDRAAEAERSATAEELAGLVALMRSESEADHLGGDAMLNALPTAIFALVLRLASEANDAPVGLLALAGHPRLAPAMAALFNNPARPWTLPELACLCNMSRATLARQSQENLDDGCNRHRAAEAEFISKMSPRLWRFSMRPSGPRALISKFVPALDLLRDARLNRHTRNLGEPAD